MNITNTLLFFVDKMCESFALQRILTFYQQKRKTTVYLLMHSFTLILSSGLNYDVKQRSFEQLAPDVFLKFTQENEIISYMYQNP